MGKGIALEFKNRFPDMFRDYAARCRRGEVRLGRPYLYRTLMPPWILNFPTKGHWRAVSNIRDIDAGLDFLEAHYEEWGITSLAVPPLGCGNGGLEWRVVGPVLYQRLSKLDIPIELYAPVGTNTDELQSEFLSRGDSPAQRHGVGESKGEPRATARERRLRCPRRRLEGSKARRATDQQLAGHIQYVSGETLIAEYSLASREYNVFPVAGDNPVWLSDGRRLLFWAKGKILLLDARSGSFHEVLSYEPDEIRYDFGLSRDDSTIYFTRIRNEADIWMLTLDEVR